MSVIKVKRQELLRFYDVTRFPNKKRELGSHVSAITGLIGEDLVIGLFLHYLRKNGHKADIVSYQCKGKHLKGKRLDAWLRLQSVAGPTLYQVEVKNWSGHSMNGYDLPVESDLSRVQLFASKKWKYYFGAGDRLPKEIEKVLVDMEPPEGHIDLPIRKLMAFWSCVVNHHSKAFDTVQFANGTQLDVFSASAYLRGLTEDILEVEMPRADERLGLLRTFLTASSLELDNTTT